MSGPRIFPYGPRELGHLAARDPVLGQYMARRGRIERELMPDPFQGLVHAIVGQQISARAQAAIWQRLTDLTGRLAPRDFLDAGIERIRACGVSLRKAQSMLDIALAFAKGDLAAEDLALLSDQELARKLTGFKGLGPWTVEMVLIFSFARPDVFSECDFGLRKGLARLHGPGADSPANLRKYRDLYAPYATTACLYLWELAGEKADLP